MHNLTTLLDNGLDKVATLLQQVLDNKALTATTELYSDQDFGSPDDALSAKYTLINPQTYANPPLAEAVAQRNGAAYNNNKRFYLLQKASDEKYFSYSIKALKAFWNMSVIAKKLLSIKKFFSIKSNIVAIDSLIPFLSEVAVPQVVDDITHNLADIIQKQCQEFLGLIGQLTKNNPILIGSIEKVLGLSVQDVIAKTKVLIDVSQIRMDQYHARIKHVERQKLIDLKQDFQRLLIKICPAKPALDFITNLPTLLMKYDDPDLINQKPISQQVQHITELIEKVLPGMVKELANLAPDKKDMLSNLQELENSILDELAKLPQKIMYYEVAKEAEYFNQKLCVSQMYGIEIIASAMRDDIKSLREYLIASASIQKFPTTFIERNIVPLLAKKQTLLNLERDLAGKLQGYLGKLTQITMDAYIPVFLETKKTNLKAISNHLIIIKATIASMDQSLAAVSKVSIDLVKLLEVGSKEFVSIDCLLIDNEAQGFVDNVVADKHYIYKQHLAVIRKTLVECDNKAGDLTQKKTSLLKVQSEFEELLCLQSKVMSQNFGNNSPATLTDAVPVTLSETGSSQSAITEENLSEPRFPQCTRR